jgi:outer membrane protein OmpA-like peptidoglycan-associated protein
VRRALQRKCACGGTCNSCGGATAPPIVQRVLGESGRPLDRATRALMEPRFGHNFSSVRVHDGARAAQSAAEVDASAYTVGNHIVFGSRAPRDELLAHELTHVVQQSGADSSGPLRIGDANDPLEREADANTHAHAAHAAAPRMLQRACDPAHTGLGAVPPMPACAAPAGPGSGESFLFCQDSTELLPGEETRLTAMSARLATAKSVNVNGYASTEGPRGREEEYNLTLACHRANHVAGKLIGGGVPASKIKTIRHGATTEFGAGLAPNRRVLVGFETTPEPPKAKNCGPDITKWFIGTMNAAKFDPRVQRVERGLAVAASIGQQEGMSSINFVETELRDRANDAATKTNASQPPPKNVQDQLSAAGKHPRPSRPFFSQPNPLGNIAGMSTALYLALTDWRDLVNHGAPFDFKAHKLLQSNLNANGCDDPCANASVTIAGKCFRNDVPGNLFYAYIGGWVGLSENALQLGSITAQLNSPTNPGWDPPDDTQMISVGFNLPKLLLNEITLGASLASVPAREPCTPCAKEYWPK